MKNWVALSLTLLLLVPMIVSRPSEESEATAAEPIPAPQAEVKPKPEDYVGMTKCAACHFKEYQTWKNSAHARAASQVPAKYRNNAECMGCHASYHHQARADQPNLQLTGVGCEDCHGPGRDHAEFALSFIDQKTELNEATITLLRSKIDRTSLKQCIRCHLSQAHKEHPKFDRDESLKPSSDAAQSPTRRRSVFDVH